MGFGTLFRCVLFFSYHAAVTETVMCGDWGGKNTWSEHQHIARNAPSGDRAIKRVYSLSANENRETIYLGVSAATSRLA